MKKIDDQFFCSDKSFKGIHSSRETIVCLMSTVVYSSGQQLAARGPDQRFFWPAKNFREKILKYFSTEIL
jgi:hypothetical protein